MSLHLASTFFPAFQPGVSYKRALSPRVTASDRHCLFKQGSALRRSDDKLTLQAGRATSQVVMVMTESSELEIGTSAPAFEVGERCPSPQVRAAQA